MVSHWRPTEEWPIDGLWSPIGGLPEHGDPEGPIEGLEREPNIRQKRAHAANQIGPVNFVGSLLKAH